MRMGIVLAGLLLVVSSAEAVAETLPIKMNGKECGSAEISIAPNDSKDPAPGSIIFDFKAAREAPKECCKKYGWIQHVKPTGGGEWSYDNGAGGGLGRGIGAPSEPEKEKQPTQRPADIPKDGRWRENPWYGAPTNADDDKETFARNPTPQTKIGDKPDKRGDEFRTQLVCVETGEVLTTWSWTAAEPGKERRSRRRSERAPFALAVTARNCRVSRKMSEMALPSGADKLNKVIWLDK